ncbi:MAG: formate dehydrogenase subunit gamma [Alsobacter sp.]
MSDGGPNTAPITVRRFGRFKRLNHWITAVLFLLLALSGLALYHPGFFFLSALFGGGTSARAVHPWLGVALCASFFVLACSTLLSNLWTLDDVRWMLRFGRVIANRHDGLPELGKFNAGQKGVYWTQLLLIPALLLSGLGVWEDYFGTWTTIAMQRKAMLVHSVAGVAAITVIIMHVYAGFWIKGTMRGMLQGSVTGGWAWTHHRKWLRRMAARDAAIAAMSARVTRPPGS